MSAIVRSAIMKSVILYYLKTDHLRALVSKRGEAIHADLSGVKLLPDSEKVEQSLAKVLMNYPPTSAMPAIWLLVEP